MISCFKNIKSPTVVGEIDIYDFIESIKTPNPNLRIEIEKAREYIYHDEKDKYVQLKETLPCFSLNFSFNQKKKNSNIKSPTGLIYIDIDNGIEIDLDNRYIFAAWKSLSGLGRGVLVKVNGLTLNNFKKTYFDISRELNIVADKYAAKATQYNIHSYDKDIYINEDSLIWYAKEDNKTPITLTYREKKRKDIKALGVNPKILYNNINDLDFGDSEYLFFPEEKEAIAQAFIPPRIYLGQRNQILSAIAFQIRALNPELPIEDYKRFILNINSSRCTEPLKENEVLGIASKVLNNESLEPIYNKPRRIIFNPNLNITNEKKRKITNKYLGQLRVKRTKFEIKECLENWDFDNLGKVTQKKLALETRKNIKTIEKYYKYFKEHVYIINQSTLLKSSTSF